MTATHRMSVEATRQVVLPYLTNDAHDDVSVMAPDVVFRVMASGDEYRGPDAVQGMLDFFYRVAFDAHADTRNIVVDEGVAVLEAELVGRHIGEFAGVPATGKDVRVPVAVVYDVRDGQIVEGRVYFEVPVFLAQVSTPE